MTTRETTILNINKAGYNLLHLIDTDKFYVTETFTTPENNAQFFYLRGRDVTQLLNRGAEVSVESIQIEVDKMLLERRQFDTSLKYTFYMC